ncbi:SPFH domain-containing protein [Dactylosporangium sp. NBC_01737]|uniref:SPFH domain-containing protein n=1 Tax=Dactylosporangium sp. NBC_01737 TaxID=2975959 RepID=UPI002E0FEEBA|nr:SPFH domain-containing protein [Dactylosporangium sp. NBC_01737]
MDAPAIIGCAAAIGCLALAARAAVRVIRPHERGVVVRLGRPRVRTRAPGPTFVLPGVDRLHRVSLWTVVADVAAQDVITRDKVAVGLHALVTFHVVDPAAALFGVEDYQRAVPATARAAIRAAISRVDLGDLLANRADLNAALTGAVVAAVDDGWGVRVDRVQLEELGLPASLTRVMARQVRERHSVAGVTPALYVPSGGAAKPRVRAPAKSTVTWAGPRSPMDC